MPLFVSFCFSHVNKENKPIPLRAALRMSKIKKVRCLADACHVTDVQQVVIKITINDKIVLITLFAYFRLHGNT